MTLIDPPTPFATTEEWREFLVEMRLLARKHPDDQDIREHLEMAEREVRLREKR